MQEMATTAAPDAASTAHQPPPPHHEHHHQQQHHVLPPPPPPPPVQEEPLLDDVTAETFTTHDVVLGKGNGINSLPGNLRFRKIIVKYKPLYAATPRSMKSTVAELVIQEIDRLDPPGRFLEPLADQRFRPVTRKRAIEKTCQALREKKNNLGQQASQARQQPHPVVPPDHAEQGGPTMASSSQPYHGPDAKPMPMGPSGVPLAGSAAEEDSKLETKENKESKTIVATVMENDVLYGGRGRRHFHRVANQRFLELVKMSRKEYHESRCKKTVAKRIVKEWQEQSPPGRFLQQDPKTENWYEISETKIMEKTCQALRDMKRERGPAGEKHGISIRMVDPWERQGQAPHMNGPPMHGQPMPPPGHHHPYPWMGQPSMYTPPPPPPPPQMAAQPGNGGMMHPPPPPYAPMPPQGMPPGNQPGMGHGMPPFVNDAPMGKNDLDVGQSSLSDPTHNSVESEGRTLATHPRTTQGEGTVPRSEQDHFANAMETTPEAEPLTTTADAAQPMEIQPQPVTNGEEIEAPKDMGMLSPLPLAPPPLPAPVEQATEQPIASSALVATPQVMPPVLTDKDATNGVGNSADPKPRQAHPWDAVANPVQETIPAVEERSVTPPKDLEEPSQEPEGTSTSPLTSPDNDKEEDKTVEPKVKDTKVESQEEEKEKCKEEGTTDENTKNKRDKPNPDDKEDNRKKGELEAAAMLANMFR